MKPKTKTLKEEEIEGKLGETCTILSAMNLKLRHRGFTSKLLGQERAHKSLRYGYRLILL